PPRVRRTPQDDERQAKEEMSSEREAVRNPVGERPGAELVVEADRGFVPIQDGPFHPAALLAARLAEERVKELLPEPVAAIVREDEEVFEVERRPREKGAVGEEVDGIPNRGTILPGRNVPPRGTILPGRIVPRRGTILPGRFVPPSDLGE